VFLEVFAGTARLASAMAQRGFHVLAWDIRYGEEYDLKRERNRQLIRGWILGRRIIALHLGTPCNSWSRVRDFGPGPPRLRSDEHVLGLPDLRPCDRIAVTTGNLFMQFSVSVLLACRRMSVPASMENPGRSRLWIAPPVKRLFSLRRFQFTLTDYCQWGTPWMKTAGFLSVCADLSQIERRCHRVNKCCSRSGQRHQVLCGKHPSGVWWTSIAEGYPRTLCRALALCLDNAIVANQAMRLHSKLL